MPIVDLIVAACLMQAPQTCQEAHLRFQAGRSLQDCMFQAMPEVAKWAGEHPQWHVTRFHCEWLGTGKDT
jgi:hypothetical protein